MQANIISQLRQIVGQEYVLDALVDRACYSFDATFKDSFPDVVVKPNSVDEIVEVVKLANEYDIPVTCRGAATGLSGGCIPLKGGISLVLTRLNKIIDIDVENRYAIIEPGLIAEDFALAVEKSGLFYPPDPGSIKTATMGGTLSECAGGPRGVKYGVTRDFILGCEVVLPDGSVTMVGNNVDSEMAGPDWSSLIVGSEGTLGVVTKIYVRLIDKPQSKQTMLAIFDKIEDAATTVSTMMASGTIPTTLEIMDNLTIRVVENFLQIGLPIEADAALIIEVDGNPDAVKKHAASVMKVCHECGATEVQIAKNKQESDNLWRARRAISPACGKINPTKISEDATVPRNQIPTMVKHIREIAEKYKLKMVIFGHAGDGNLHPNILTNKHDHEEMERVELAVEELFKVALKLGGTLSGEHGIGYMKAPFLTWETGKIGFDTARSIKGAFDTKGIMNPGKMFNYAD